MLVCLLIWAARAAAEADGGLLAALSAGQKALNAQASL
jgi:hypothetical protein